MLSRVADSLYWLNRYIERAENIARIIDVNLNFILDCGISSRNEQWEPLLKITGEEQVFFEKYKEPTRENVIQFLLFDDEYPGSILSCLSIARENAISVREIINIETWEQVNKFYMFVNRAKRRRISINNIHDFLEEVKRNCHIFSGIQDSTISRGESWHFGRLGRMIERADQTSRIIHIKYFHILPSSSPVGSTYDLLQWAAILKSASGFEMYTKKYKSIKPDKILEFLILDNEFPRSINYCLTRANERLHAISASSSDSYSNKPEQSLGAVKSELAYSDINTIIDIGLHEFIDSIQLKLIEINQDIFNRYFNIKENFNDILFRD